MSTTTHDHTLIVKHDGCHHDVCAECDPHVITTRGTITSRRVKFTYRHKAVPVVGQTLRITDSNGTAHIGHVTSVNTDTGEWHAHVQPEPEPQVDLRWLATDPAEQAAVAHLRGWTHFGPVCPICMAGR